MRPWTFPPMSRRCVPHTFPQHCPATSDMPRSHQLCRRTVIASASFPAFRGLPIHEGLYLCLPKRTSNASHHVRLGSTILQLEAAALLLQRLDRPIGVGAPEGAVAGPNPAPAGAAQHLSAPKKHRCPCRTSPRKPYPCEKRQEPETQLLA